jgi:hypothetical protein
MIPFYLNWKTERGDRYFRTYDSNADTWADETLAHGVLHPAGVSDVQVVVLENPARFRRLIEESRFGRVRAPLEKVTDIKLYLSAEQDVLERLLVIWPSLNAGVEVSMDHGITWHRFSTTCGNPEDPSTWLPLAAAAVNEGAVAGELGPFPPFDRATLMIRLRTPMEAPYLGDYSFQLEANCTVL